MNNAAKSGSALLIVVCFVLAILNVLAVSFLIATGSRAQIARRQLALEESFYVAEAGAESAVAYLMAGLGTNAVLTGSVGNGNFVVYIEAEE